MPKVKMRQIIDITTQPHSKKAGRNVKTSLISEEEASSLLNGKMPPPPPPPPSHQQHSSLSVSLLRMYVKIGKSVGVNILCVIILVAYIICGAFAFLHFERHFDVTMRRNRSQVKTDCVQRILAAQLPNMAGRTAGSLARTITNACIMEKLEPRQQWTFINSALYAFGIVTTLGYGKVEPFTANGRIFAVIYGFIGVPITMIIFSNFGKFIEYFVLDVYHKHFKRAKSEPVIYHNALDPSILITMIFFYLLFGALLMPLLNGRFEIFNGAYWSFLCFTAIEYGELIPFNPALLPIAIGYICLGLAISTIALDVGSGYVRRLHFVGRQLRNLAHINIWFGGKKLKLRELVTAIGQNIGLEASILRDMDLETVVKSAILVKEGKLDRVPQTLMLVEGIWPPELVPLFLKDGVFPQYADDDNKEINSRTGSIACNSRTPSCVKIQQSECLILESEDEPGTTEIEEGQDTETTVIT